ncbi:MAG: DUF1761 domain-containing protein [Patescibacteria group bacterium]
MPPVIDVNGWAVLVGSVAAMVLGFVWYMPAVFGKIWMEGTSRTVTGIEQAKKTMNMNLIFGLQFVGWLLGAYVLAHFAGYAGATTAVAGAQAGFWAWLGFVMPVNLGATLWDRHSWGSFAVTTGYNLVSLLIIGAIIGAWR